MIRVVEPVGEDVLVAWASRVQAPARPSGRTLGLRFERIGVRVAGERRPHIHHQHRGRIGVEEVLVGDVQPRVSSGQRRIQVVRHSPHPFVHSVSATPVDDEDVTSRPPLPA